MPPNTVQIQIIPESNTIHLFRDESTTMNETYDLRGHVRLIPIIYNNNPYNKKNNNKKNNKKKKKKKTKNSSSPLLVHHIELRLKGYVQTMLTSDFSDSDKVVMDDQRWCKDTTTLPLLDRILYSARGYANVTECVLDQQLTISPGILSLTKVTDVPFSFPIENTQMLPPSISSPRHLICYYITATVNQQPKLSTSMSTTSLLTIQPSTTLSSSSSSSSSSSAATPPPPPSRQLDERKNKFTLRPQALLRYFRKLSSTSSFPMATTATTEEATTTRSPPSSTTLSSSTSFSSFSNNNPSIPTVRLPLTIECHHVGSSYALTRQPRIRYCGARPNALRYQIHLAKYMRLQYLPKPTDINFHCSLFPLSPMIRLKKIVCFLVQYETYPLRSGHVHPLEPIPPNQLETKAKKIGYMEHIVTPQDTLERLSLSLSLSNPQLVPPVNTASLIITHKLRMAVYFEGKEKKMTLSFPVVFCSVPPPSTVVQPTHISMNRLLSMYHDNDSTTFHELNHSHRHLPLSECKLPSYLDVMSEGAPPSPFLDDPLSI